MTLRTLPDAERLVSTFLRDQAEVTALVGSRVYTSLPQDKTYPLVRLQRIGGAPELTDDGLLWDRADLQVDVWGGNKATTWQVAETLRAVFAARARGLHASLGYCEGVELGAARYQPDETFSPARPRVLFDTTVYLRPAGDRST
jgi:hypothetical protein